MMNINCTWNQLRIPTLQNNKVKKWNRRERDGKVDTFLMIILSLFFCLFSGERSIQQKSLRLTKRMNDCTWQSTQTDTVTTQNWLNGTKMERIISVANAKWRCWREMVYFCRFSSAFLSERSSRDEWRWEKKRFVDAFFQNVTEIFEFEKLWNFICCEKQFQFLEFEMMRHAVSLNLLLLLLMLNFNYVFAQVAFVNDAFSVNYLIFALSYGKR